MQRRFLVTLFSTSLIAACVYSLLGHPEPVPAAASETSRVADSWNLRGRIGGNLLVTMTLHRTGKAVSGEYFYERRSTAYVPVSLDLVGTRKDPDKISLQETDPNGKQTGIFSGKLISVADKPQFIGTWSNAGATRSLPVQLESIDPTISADGARIVAQSAESIGKRPRYTIASAWPHLVTDPSSGASGDAFNAAVRKTIAAIENDFRGFMREMAADPPPGSRDAERSYMQETTFDVASLTPRAVSVAFTIFADTGGAHPNTVTRTLNYDRTTNRTLHLQDVFRPGFRYLDFLSRQCRLALHEDFLRSEGLHQIPFPEGVTPKEANFSNWTLAPQGLIVHFDRYQVAAYAEGDRDVILPWRLLKPHLRPNGPATPLVIAES